MMVTPVSPAHSTRVKPTQAVVLAGGRGTRLLPLTATCPKPMIEFHGRPFLEYLVSFLRGQGIAKVLLLLGYLPEVIMNYFGDGSRFGLSIEYHVSDVDNDTGRRLKLAEDRLDPEFFLLYCDNYLPINFAELWSCFFSSDALVQLLAYRNDDSYTKSNLIVDSDGRVIVYDKSRTTTGLSGVDVGFALVRRQVMNFLPDDGNVSFEALVYPLLVNQGRLAAVLTEHRYYSVGDHKRLPLTETFLARQPTIFLDRDGTLNQRQPPAQYVTSWDQWVWLPGAVDALRRLTEAGWRIIIVTNQPGIARGALDEKVLAEIHRRMVEDATAAGAQIADIMVCPHGWDDGCVCRKPRPGMLFSAQRRYQLDLSRTPLIGDDERDGEAARAAGCPFYILGQDETLGDVVSLLLEGRWVGAWEDP